MIRINTTMWAAVLSVGLTFACDNSEGDDHDDRRRNDTDGSHESDKSTADSEAGTETSTDGESNTTSDGSTRSDMDSSSDSGTKTKDDTGTSSSTDGDTSDTDIDNDIDVNADTQPGNDKDADDGSDAATANDADATTEVEIEPYETDPTKITLSPPCDLAIRVGEFRVQENNDGIAAYVTATGKVDNGVTPMDVMDLYSKEEECELLLKRRLECDPICSSGTSCDEKGNCIATPVGQNLGTAVIQGLSQTITMQPTAIGNRYSYNKLPYPAWEPGVVVHLSTTEGYMGRLSLDGIGVQLLTLTDAEITMTDGEPLALHWISAQSDAESLVQLRINVNLHAVGTPMVIDCEFADDGEGIVSAALISTFIDAGVSGFPEAYAVRRTVDSFTNDKGCIEFIVGSRRKQSLTVTGYVPCNRDDECPEDFTCNESIQTCVPQ